MLSYDVDAVRQRVLEKRKKIIDPEEKCLALYIESDPQEMACVLQMIDAGDGKGHLPMWAHALPSMSHAEEVKSELEEKYGAVRLLGETYKLKSYSITYKRSDKLHEEETRFVIEKALTRKNVKKLANYLLFDKKNFNMIENNIENYKQYEMVEEFKSFPKNMARYVINMAITILPDALFNKARKKVMMTMEKERCEMTKDLTQQQYNDKLTTFYLRDAKMDQKELDKMAKWSPIFIGALRTLDFS